MSIVKFFTDRFGRVRPITPKSDLVPQSTADQPVSNSQQNVTLVDVRKEGFKDGVLEIDKSPFESWITHSEELEVVKHNLGVQRGELARLTNQLNRAETEGERLRVEIAGSTENITLQEQFLEQNIEKVDEIKQEQQSFLEKIEGINPAYDWVPAILFLIAGAALLAADYVVSMEIVAKGMNLGGTEATLFATAMAMMAFAVKPAVDRIFEKSYKDGSIAAKKRNHWFIGIVALLVLFSLSLLGFFRSDAEGLMSQIKSKEHREEVLMSKTSLTEIEETELTKIRGELSDLNAKLLENPAKRWSFIALAVMFALAGAVCLSIAFPSLEQHFRKDNLTNHSKKLLKQLKSLEDEQKITKQHIADNKATVSKSEVILKELAAPETLVSKIQELQVNISENVLKYHQIKALALTDTYRDAYAEAISYDVEGRPTIYWKEVDGLNSIEKDNKPSLLNSEQPVIQSNNSKWFTKLLGNSQASSNEDAKPTYAHQKLRKLIQERKLN
ncbi:hypothetical protein K3G39_06990 [Pontibacter sp. HSC-14F20]|uniref:hypothetical protein n=1 Tax=Pontibacter sp. HSC-14F20 TaxID=2864136 RepID=UPI001C730091|nr:hypothetical protein [Pontibacter sp. HSC-14F20]MBX0332979.1 hypothetical protein [Pontibacter sp. HSC-14F20]